MKRLIFFITTVFLSLSFVFTVLASTQEQTDRFREKFVIIGGIDIDKAVKATFDRSKTISGTAEVGSTVTIEVYELYSSGKLGEPSVYSVVVGSSGYFSQNVELSLGENLIRITAQKKDISSTVEATIKRKKSEIKSELVKNISFPRV